ncbi:ABC transporter permease [Mucilaginibacter sp. OK283]|uniref:ABC transporter permease n=1 Tax=Mucilaginibacter sp. OK283 TaxID=1881049 RepID=UPI0008B62C24|nr:ABC transporter permease [Mucilaginibacter sp. OK283]SEO62693.1 ABC-type transport system, involved in lipoprotein release, permease component [Mucilaginibacter sp. OK283]
MNPYTFHISLFDLVFLGAIFIELTFSLQLWFAKGVNRAANRFIGLATATVVLWMAWVLGIDIRPDSFFPGWNWLPLQFSMSLGPLIYFYVLKITRPEYQFRWKNLLHFSPWLLQLAVWVLEIMESIRTGGATYDTLIFRQLSPVLDLSAFISVTVYLYLSFRLIERFYQQLEFNTVNDRYRYQLRWLHRLLTIFGLLWLLWVPYIAIDYFYYHHQLGIHAYYPLYFLLAVMTTWLSAVAFFRQETSVPAESTALFSAPLPAEMKQRGTWLKKAVQAGLYYQDPDLSLTSLAEKLELSPHELSRIINTALKKSFNDFVGEYRVAAVVQKMQNPAYDHITLLGIAFESGFNSKTTFNRTFKQITGKSPAEYKNRQKKEGPSYSLGRSPRFAKVISFQETTPTWSTHKLNRNYMFKNYFKIAWRNLTRNKSYAAINIIGMAVGIAVCMMIFIIIQYHTSFDAFHSKKDRIYRVLTEYHHQDAGNISYGKDLPFPLPLGLKTAFTQVEQVAPIFASQNDQLLIPDNNGTTVKVFKEERGLFYTQPSFFKIFDFPLLAGSYESLKDPNNVLLTKETAEKYFGDWKTAIGKSIKLQMGGFMFEHGTDVLKVSGILATIPANSDFQLKLVVSFGTGFTGDYLIKSTDWDRTVADFGCYILLPPNVAAGNFNQQLSAYSKKVKSTVNKDIQMIQPLNAVHYDTQVANYSNKSISRQLLNVLWLIAAFILSIACVNFINLSTAQAVNRAKEIGVRKVLGSSKSQLQIQFIVETFLIVAGAVILAAIITFFAVSAVSRLLELSLSFNIFSNPAIILFLFAITIVVTALAGFYPAVVLSRFSPVNALKSKLSTNSANGISLRRGLVVFQFIIAQALIIGTIIIVRQMNYFMDQPLGFDKDAVVNIPFRIDSLRMSRYDYLKNQLLAINGVQAVSYSSNTPIENNNDTWSTIKFNHSIKESDFKAITKFADEGYIPVYKLQLIAGRNLQPSMTTREFLVNESLVKSLGLKNPEDILNKEISIWDGVIKCPVVGVLKDFNDRSFRHGLAPLLVATNGTMYNQVGIKLKTTNIFSTMQSVKQIFEKSIPDFVYEYKFLDDKIAGFYKQENQLAALYKIFAAIAIFLSCLGLYGLASFMTVQRIKEVGIRKILGATSGSIVYLFSKEFVILITIAFAVAAPIAWYYMHQWLQAYAYRISISWWLLAAGGLAAILIALVTISFQAIKAAKANPVKSLRNE